MVPPELIVTVDAGPRSGDAVRALREWLAEDDELRGRVRLRPGEPPDGVLGALGDALVVAAPVAGALAPALISWIRSRHTDVTVKIARADGVNVEVSAQRVRRLGAADVAEELERLVRATEPPAPADAADG